MARSQTKPRNRRREYDNRMKAAGYCRVQIWVPAHERQLVLELRELLSRGVENPDQVDALRDFFSCTYESILRDPESDEGDLAYAKEKLRLLRQERDRQAVEEARYEV